MDKKKKQKQKKTQKIKREEKGSDQTRRNWL